MFHAAKVGRAAQNAMPLAKWGPWRARNAAATLLTSPVSSVYGQDDFHFFPAALP